MERKNLLALCDEVAAMGAFSSKLEGNETGMESVKGGRERKSNDIPAINLSYAMYVRKYNFKEM
ncbi:MAG: hypothetical protein PQJ60_11325 [Spirochaetales bacterium]|nr:hypothetical protein [Spirochaetales bacterium]